MYNSQLSKIKSGIGNKSQVILNLSSILFDDFNNEGNFLHKLLLTNIQVSKICKVFSNYSSANVKLPKTQLSKMIQLGKYPERLLVSFLKNCFSLMKNVLKPLGKSALIPLGLTTTALATDVAILKKVFRSGMTALIISNEEMDDIMKIFKFLKESGLSIKDGGETIQNETKEQIGAFFGMLLGTLRTSLLGNLLTGKEVNGQTYLDAKLKYLNKVGEGTKRVQLGQAKIFSVASSLN